MVCGVRMVATRDGTYTGGSSGLELDELEFAHQGMRIHARIHVTKEGAGALLEMSRTRDRQDALARALPHVFQHQEGQPAEMIAMQMADKNTIDVDGIDSGSA